MQHTAEPSALPRRMCGTSTTSGLIISHDRSQISAARRWAAQATHSGPALACDVAQVASELVTNAHQHTASGLPGGSVHLEVERSRVYVTLRVTDNGPRPGTPRIPYPRLPEKPDPDAAGGRGLALVSALCGYWDWEGLGVGIMVRALFSR